MIYREGSENRAVATIVSNDGWDSIDLISIRTVEQVDSTLVLARLEMTGRFWDRGESLTSVHNADLNQDFQVSLPQVLISELGMRQLIEQLQGWLTTYAGFELQFPNVEDQTLCVGLCESENFITRPDHPLFTLRYSSSRIAVESRFVTDPSCISDFLQGLLQLVAKV